MKAPIGRFDLAEKRSRATLSHHFNILGSTPCNIRIFKAIRPLDVKKMLKVFTKHDHGGHSAYMTRTV